MLYAISGTIFVALLLLANKLTSDHDEYFNCKYPVHF